MHACTHARWCRMGRCTLTRTWRGSHPCWSCPPHGRQGAPHATACLRSCLHGVGAAAGGAAAVCERIPMHACRGWACSSTRTAPCTHPPSTPGPTMRQSGCGTELVGTAAAAAAAATAIPAPRLLPLCNDSLGLGTAGAGLGAGLRAAPRCAQWAALACKARPLASTGAHGWWVLQLPCACAVLDPWSIE